MVRNYIFALWLADISHVAITASVMGYDQAVDVANWNSMAWGNIGITVSRMAILVATKTNHAIQIILFIIRSAYFLGFLGDDRTSMVEKKGQ